MKIHTNISSNSNSSGNPLQNIMNNLNYQDKKIVKEALSQVPEKELPKVLKELNKIPVDKNYIKSLINAVNRHLSKTPQTDKGFMLYA
jgi:hypothetical protein